MGFFTDAGRKVSTFAAFAALIGCATPRFNDVAARFQYRVAFELGDSEFKEGNALEIQEVWGTRPQIEVGGEYLVHGRYRLSAFQDGMLFLHETATDRDNSGVDVDLQYQKVRAGEGSFTLLHSFPGPGYLHVELHGRHDGELVRVGNVYFGKDETLRARHATGRRAP